MIDNFKTDLVLRVAPLPRDEILQIQQRRFPASDVCGHRNGHGSDDQRISRIKKRLEEERQAFKPYIWVDTGFVRKSQPIFALAVCEHQRYLDCPEGFWRFSIDRQLGRAQCRVREHVYETGADLGIWGPIKQYWFYYNKHAAYLLALNGEVVGKHEEPGSNLAIGSAEK